MPVERVYLHDTSLEVVPHALDISVLCTKRGDGLNLSPDNLIHVSNWMVLRKNIRMTVLVNVQVSLDFVSSCGRIFTEFALVEEVVKVKDPFHEVAHDAEAVFIGIRYESGG